MHRFYLDAWNKNKRRNSSEVISDAGTEGRNASDVVEDVFIVMLNVVSECVP